jgi:hypothetical protein
MKRFSFLVLAAGLASTAMLPARAALTNMFDGVGGPSGNGNASLVFLGLDTSNVSSLVVDLGYFYTDAVGAAFNTPGTTIQWNFATNALSVNGVAQSGSYNWSAPYSAFSGAANAANTKWAVISGAGGNYPNYFVTTGNPTPAQVASQTTDLTGNMLNTNALYGLSNGVTNASGRVSTQGLAGFGANSVVGQTQAAAGYVGNFGVFGPPGNEWTGGNLKWSAYASAGAANSNGLWSLNNDVDGALRLSGAFAYSAGVLTYTTAPVPEAEAGLLAAAGLSVLWFARRRRPQA